ncbi:MAG: choice-of-anchor V domain-containing protein [Bryobacteraceae bacterium]|nr:choice-of-anchor V domain-containing protein [Bryobacteraceae bacterium]
MKKKALVVFGFAALPLLLLAYSGGADPGHAGVPNERGNCTACHLGSPNSGSGRVAIALADGATTYSPGVPVRVTVTVTDTNPASGFQLTARLADSSATQAGTFEPADASTRRICAGSNLIEQPCTTSSLQYIQQSSPRPIGTGFQFTWTPPANATGEIVLYASGNAVNNNSSTSGDRVYTTTLRVSPAAAPTRPTIRTTDGVLTATAFYTGGTRAAAPGSWVEIYGTGLASAQREWAGSDFTGNTAPTNLGGVSVSVGGQPAAVYFTNPASGSQPSQVNAQIPNVANDGPVAVTVTNANGTTDAYQLTLQRRLCAMLAPASFNVGGRQFVVAQHSDNVFVGPPGFLSGVTTRAAVPGNTIVIYAVGCGATTPAVTPGQIVTTDARLPNPVIRFGSTNVTVAFAGLTQQSVGLYQFNLTVPNIAPGEYEIGGSIDGVALPAGLFINLRQ